MCNSGYYFTGDSNSSNKECSSKNNKNFIRIHFKLNFMF
jgi:hypothetical protein